MFRLIFSAVLILIVLCVSSIHVNATVIYDWVTLGSEPDDSGNAIVHASWEITDKEYNDGLFSTLTPGNKITGLIKDVFTSYDFYISPFNLYQWGVLSTDKNTISLVHEYEMNTDYVFLYDMPSDYALCISANEAWGHEYGNGYDYQIHILGEWVLREGTAPVPEPSTFLLFGVGLGGFALYRRRMIKKM